MLTNSGCCPVFGIYSRSARDSGASMKAMSAPLSQHRLTRSMASSRLFIWRASVRAKMTKSGSLLAFTAALIFNTISSLGMTRLLAKWPQRLGITFDEVADDVKHVLQQHYPQYHDAALKSAIVKHTRHAQHLKLLQLYNY